MGVRTAFVPRMRWIHSMLGCLAEEEVNSERVSQARKLDVAIIQSFIPSQFEWRDDNSFCMRDKAQCLWW